MQKTFSPKAKEITREWHVIDASGVPLGRLASQVAQLLRGKHKPTYAPHLDGGDHVIVLNAAKVALTGAKLDQKKYYRHSGYPGRLQGDAAWADGPGEAAGARDRAGGAGDGPAHLARQAAARPSPRLRRSEPSARRAGRLRASLLKPKGEATS